MNARAWMVLGTASDSGKSTIVAGLCRALANRGIDVAPFKAQNMARNAFVCADGAEIGVAQAVQAQAARVEPCADHNPILLKPELGMRSQLVVSGKSWGTHSFGELLALRPQLMAALEAALARLSTRHELLLMEGAGSPAEVNLHDRDLANLAATRAADAQVLLVADIDRGGVFASILGTLELLPDDIRPRVRGLIINKFRGELSLLEPGLAFLRARTGLPVLGVLPFLDDLALPDEDSVALARHRGRARAGLDQLEIALVDTPYLANFEDVLPLRSEPGVVLRLTASARELLEADLVILGGSKCSVRDLEFLRERGLARALLRRAERAEPLLGICGGAQLLGTRIEDPEAIESDRALVPALGILGHYSRYERPKLTRQARGQLLLGAEPAPVAGFFLHYGRLHDTGAPLVQLDDGSAEGARQGSNYATMLHRLFDQPAARRVLLRELRQRRGLPEPAAGASAEDPYERLARQLQAALDWPRLCTLLGV